MADKDTKATKVSKKSVEKCKDLASVLVKQLFEHKDIVDFDFLITASRINHLLSNSVSASVLKKHNVDGPNVARLELLLSEFCTEIGRITKEKRLMKRYMQNTRVRKKLDQLNNFSYRIVKTLAQRCAGEKKKDKKDKKDKYKIEPAKIVDEAGESFWRNSFGDEDVMVPWETFQQHLMQAVPNARENEEGIENLKYILDNSATGEVTLYKFSEFLKGFGPLNQCIEKASSLLSKRWFHGFLTSEESELFLAQQPIGVFLVRFSKSKPGSFALAYVDKGKKIGHTLVYSTPDGFTISESKQATEKTKMFESLDGLIENYSNILKVIFFFKLVSVQNGACG